MTRHSTRLAWLATGLAAAASAAGLFAGVYRDVPAMIDQAQAADLATLLVAAPLLVAALVRGWRVVAAAGLAYLAYVYAIFSFEVVLNPATVAYIAILSLSLWARALGLPALRPAAGIGQRLPRRTSAGFLAVVATMFAALWLSEIAGSIGSGELPLSVSELHVPTSAVYALDLGFVLPILGLAALLLVRRSPYAAPLALGSLVFLVLMALSILPLFVLQAARGDLADPTGALVFTAIGAIAAILALLGLGPVHAESRPQAVAPAH